jgi:hypothetical protein
MSAQTGKTIKLNTGVIKETLIYDNWFHYVEKQSQYINGVKVMDEEASYFTCPGCHRHYKDMEHGQEVICSCGLHMQRWGNGLDIWK